MVTVRLARAGAKKRPFYRVVVSDSRAKRDGRYIERLGFYNPVAQGQEVPLRIDTARIEYWRGQGAQITNSVKSLVKKQKAQLVGSADAAGEASANSAPKASGGEEAAQPSA